MLKTVSQVYTYLKNSKHYLKFFLSVFILAEFSYKYVENYFNN